MAQVNIWVGDGWTFTTVFWKVNHWYRGEDYTEDEITLLAGQLRGKSYRWHK